MEYRFRGFDAVCDKGFVYGDLVHDKKVTITGLEDRVKVGGYEVVAESVGLWTGLKDRKDRDIYDGDILFVEFSDKSGGYYLVGWNEEMASWGIMDRYEYQSIKEGFDFAEFKNHTLLAFFKAAIICEVVGNIHDNPELMNVPNNK